MSRRRTSYRSPAKLSANVLLLANPERHSEEREKVNRVLDEYEEGRIHAAEAALFMAESYPVIFSAYWKDLHDRAQAFGAVLDLMQAAELRDFMKHLKSRQIKYHLLQVSPEGAYEAATWLRKHRGLL